MTAASDTPPGSEQAGPSLGSGPVRVLHGVADLDVRELVALLTLILLMLSGPNFWYARTPLILLGICAVVHAPLRRNPTFWLTVTVVVGSTICVNWYSQDNHKYLLAYWCLSLFCVFAVPADRQVGVLRVNGRLLVGLCMAFAACWKVISADYLDGTFFHMTLLTDARFRYFAHWFGGVPLSDLAANRELVASLKTSYRGGADVTVVDLAGSGAVRSLALAMTWWTVGIEVLLAATFLWPGGRTAATARNGLLLVFAASTYLAAPVKGFGWLLMIMGIAQCGPGERTFRVLYFVGFLLIQFYTIPYQPVVETWAAGPAVADG